MLTSWLDRQSTNLCLRFERMDLSRNNFSDFSRFSGDEVSLNRVPEDGDDSIRLGRRFTPCNGSKQRKKDTVHER